MKSHIVIAVLLGIAFGMPETFQKLNEEKSALPRSLVNDVDFVEGNVAHDAYYRRSNNLELSEAVAAKLASLSPAEKTALINEAVQYFLDNNHGSQPQTQPPSTTTSAP